MKGIVFKHKDKALQAVFKDGLVTIHTLDYVRGVPDKVVICRDRLWQGIRWYIRAFKHLF